MGFGPNSQRLVVQEQLCQVAQVLAVHFRVFAVHFKHRYAVVAVNLSAWRVQQPHLLQVPQHLFPLLEERQVVFAKVQLLQVIVLRRER